MSTKTKCQLDEERKKQGKEKEKEILDEKKKKEKELTAIREPYDKDMITFFFP